MVQLAYTIHEQSINDSGILEKQTNSKIKSAIYSYMYAWVIKINCLSELIKFKYTYTPKFDLWPDSLNTWHISGWFIYLYIP